MTETPLFCDWVVFDLETDTVVGIWKKYADADHFWSERLDDNNWAVFPATEVSHEAFVD